MTLHKRVVLGLTAGVACIVASAWVATREDEMGRLARHEGLTRPAFVRCVELTAKAREGRLSKAEWPELLAMENSANPFLQKSAKAAMIGVARFGPCRQEALVELGDWLRYPRIAFMARAPGWKEQADRLLGSPNPDDVKTANWILAAARKADSGDPRYAY